MKKFLGKLAYTLAITSIFAYGVCTIVEQQMELNSIADEKEKYMVLCEKEEMRYEQLIETIEGINSNEYIEEVAREKLGLVMPYEIIFVDTSI